jgi:integrase
MPRTKKPQAPRRRTRGEGAFGRKVIAGIEYWFAAIRTVNADGKRVRRYFYGKTAAEARAKRDDFLRKQGEEPVAEPEVEAERDTITLSTFAKRFLKAWKTRPTRQGKQHSQATIDSYAITLRVHVEPSIGTLPIRSITKDDVRRIYDKLENEDPPRRSMAARVHRTLSVLFNYAIEEGVLDKSPLATLKRSYRRPTVQPPTEAQIAAILKASKDDRLGAMIVLAIDSGARQGELFALTWDDIDFARHSITINKSASETTEGVVLTSPKTQKANRTLKVSPGTIDALKKRRAIAKREGFDQDDDFVFPSERGFVLRKSNFLRETWNPIRVAAKVPAAKFHNLRHASASLLLRSGIHPKIVQERLGHESIVLTLDTYSHLMEGMQDQAAAALGEALGRLGRRKATRSKGT